jgi:hypothetical protein
LLWLETDCSTTKKEYQEEEREEGNGQEKMERRKMSGYSMTEYLV